MRTILVVLALVLVAAMIVGYSGKRHTTEMGNETAPMEVRSPENDWMSLLGGGKSIECFLASDGVTTKMYAEGKKYRTEMEVNGKKNLSVSDGEMMWTWIEGEKQGMKMGFSCMDELRETIPEDGGPAPDYAASPEEALGEDPGFSCSEGGPVDLSVPNDVAFVDQCALIKNQLQMAEQMKNQSQQGMLEISESVKRMMEQQQ